MLRPRTSCGVWTCRVILIPPDFVAILGNKRRDGLHVGICCLQWLSSYSTNERGATLSGGAGSAEWQAEGVGAQVAVYSRQLPQLEQIIVHFRVSWRWRRVASSPFTLSQREASSAPRRATCSGCPRRQPMTGRRARDAEEGSEARMSWGGVRAGAGPGPGSGPSALYIQSTGPTQDLTLALSVSVCIYVRFQSGPAGMLETWRSNMINNSCQKQCVRFIKWEFRNAGNGRCCNVAKLPLLPRVLCLIFWY